MAWFLLFRNLALSRSTKGFFLLMNGLNKLFDNKVKTIKVFEKLSEFVKVLAGTLSLIFDIFFCFFKLIPHFEKTINSHYHMENCILPWEASQKYNQKIYGSLKSDYLWSRKRWSKFATSPPLIKSDASIA